MKWMVIYKKLLNLKIIVEEINDFLGITSKNDKNREIEDFVFILKTLCKFAEKEFQK